MYHVLSILLYYIPRRNSTISLTILPGTEIWLNNTFELEFDGSQKWRPIVQTVKWMNCEGHFLERFKEFREGGRTKREISKNFSIYIYVVSSFKTTTYLSTTWKRTTKLGDIFYMHVTFLIGTLNSRCNISRYSKKLDITNKSQLPSYFI